MNRKTALGWFLIVSGAWFLLTGLVGGDMAGIVHLGYNPDVPLSYARAPGRFVLGIFLYGAMIVLGIRTLHQARAGDAEDARRDGASMRDRG